MQIAGQMMLAGLERTHTTEQQFIMGNSVTIAAHAILPKSEYCIFSDRVRKRTSGAIKQIDANVVHQTGTSSVFRVVPRASLPAEY